MDHQRLSRKNLMLFLHIIKSVTILYLFLLFNIARAQSSNIRAPISRSSEDIREYCVVKDKDDIYNLDRFISISKDKLKRTGGKISAMDSVAEWQKQMSKDNKFNNNEACFAMTDKQASELNPVLSITTKEGLNKIRVLVRDSSVSDNTHALDPLVEAVNKVNVDGFKKYCYDVVLLDTDHQYNPLLKKICELIKSQS